MASNATKKSVSHHENLRDSGVEWIGMVPKSWLQAKLKRIITARDGGSWGDDPKGNSGDMICLRVADFDFSVGCFKEQSIEKFTVRNYTQAIIDRLHLEKGDILIEKSGGGALTPVGRSVIFDKNFPALYANFLERIRVDKNKILPEFAEYWFRSMYYSGITSAYIKQTTGIQNLDITSLLSSEYIVFPDILSQRTIVSFLNKTEVLLNQLIEDAKDSIKEYKAWKSSIIYEAVTKGVDTNVEMKDSRFEWIGKIPVNSSATRLKYIVEQIQSGTSVNAGQFPAKDEELGILKTSCVSQYFFNPNENKSINMDEYSRANCSVKKGTIIVSRMNTPELVGACGYVAKDYPNLFLPDRLWQVSFKKGVNVRFIWYFLQSPPMRQYYASLATGTSSSMQNISQAQFLNAPIIMLSETEQRKVVAFLDKKCGQIEQLITEKTMLISDLESYKKSLIYEVVTGKRKVV